jgi:hypothetical protein
MMVLAKNNLLVSVMKNKITFIAIKKLVIENKKLGIGFDLF